MKIAQWFMKFFAKQKQPTVAPEEEQEDISMRFCISDIGEEFKDTGGYKHYSNVPDPGKQEDK